MPMRWNRWTLGHDKIAAEGEVTWTPLTFFALVGVECLVELCAGLCVWGSGLFLSVSTSRGGVALQSLVF